MIPCHRIMQMHANATKEKENKKEKENSIDKANESDNEKPAYYAPKTAGTDAFGENSVDKLWRAVDNFF